MGKGPTIFSLSDYKAEPEEPLNDEWMLTYADDVERCQNDDCRDPRRWPIRAESQFCEYCHRAYLLGEDPLDVMDSMD